MNWYFEEGFSKYVCFRRPVLRWLHSVNRQNAALPEEVKFISFSVFILFFLVVVVVVVF